MENTVEKIFERRGLYPTGLVESVLDVACGLSLKSQYIDARVRVGLDIYRPYLERIDATVPYVAIHADAMRLGELFLPRSFDLVLVLDVVEHLEKHEALRLMRMAEEVARVAVIVETPKGFVPQNIDIWGHGGDEWQTHRSGWAPDDFTALGYAVVEREYEMSDARRHTDVDVPRNITMLDAIKRVDAASH